jgi:transcriptional regulator with XRE-family HTH domain
MTKLGGWPPSGFGDRLRALRERAGLTQRALAERAGCHLMTIAKLERGAQEPAWPLVLALTRALGVDCLAFAGESGVQTTPNTSPGPPPEKRGRGRPRKQPPTDASVPPAGGLEKKPRLPPPGK